MRSQQPCLQSLSLSFSRKDFERGKKLCCEAVFVLPPPGGISFPKVLITSIVKVGTVAVRLSPRCATPFNPPSCRVFFPPFNLDRASGRLLSRKQPDTSDFLRSFHGGGKRVAFKTLLRRLLCAVEGSEIARVRLRRRRDSSGKRSKNFFNISIFHPSLRNKEG